MMWSKVSLLLLGLILMGQRAIQLEKRYVILSPTESENAAKYVSRWPQETVNGTWALSQSDVDGLESNISHIADIPFPHPAYKGSQIPHPEKYYRQYAGVILNGRKIIYINALCEAAGNDGESYWREKFVFVYDGGKCFWNVRYDPETKIFSLLQVNGLA